LLNCLFPQSLKYLPGGLLEGLGGVLRLAAVTL
jgi:hypothetical protein